MAQAVITDSQLRLVYETGVDGEGKPTYKNKNYNNLDPNVTADQLFAVANAIAPLCEHTLYEIERNDSYDLIATPTA